MTGPAQEVGFFKSLELDEQRRHYDQFRARLNVRNRDHYIDQRWQRLSLPFSEVPVKRILDLGCGEGILHQYLRTKEIAYTYFGIDPSLSRVPENVSKEQGAHFVRAAGEKLPFLDKSFGLVFCNALLHHLPDVYKVLGEAIRVCCDQGQIAIIEPNRLHPLNVGLAVLKKHERGVLRLNISKACTYLMTNARTASVKRFSVNSFIYPVSIHFPRTRCFPWWLELRAGR